MNTTASINQIAVVVVNCDFVGLRLYFHAHQHCSQDYQKRQQPNKFFHGFDRAKFARKGCKMASPMQPWKSFLNRKLIWTDGSTVANATNLPTIPSGGSQCGYMAM